MYRHIRKVDNPLEILTAGFIDADHPVPEGFEITEGYPPDGYRIYQEKTLLQRLSDIFEGIPRDQAPARLRGHFRLLQASVRLALEAPIPDIEAARAMIEDARLPNGNPLPSQLEPFRAALLAEFPPV